MLPLQGAQAPSLTRKLRSHIPHSTATPPIEGREIHMCQKYICTLLPLASPNYCYVLFFKTALSVGK